MSDEDERPEVVARRHARGHREEVQGSEVCGCFYCLAVYGPGEIGEWIEAGRTAVCPRCGVDAVIGSGSGYPVTRAFLARMYAEWYAGCA